VHIQIRNDLYSQIRICNTSFNQGFGSASGSAFLETLDPDPHFKCGSGSTTYNWAWNSERKAQNKPFFYFLKRKHKLFQTFLTFFHICKNAWKKCMKFFKYFFTLKNLGLGSGSVSGSASGSVSGSASVFKTLDPDPQEMVADPKPWCYHDF